VATYDYIGCTSDNEPFQMGGTAVEGLMGSCEAYYRENLEPEVLEEVVAQTLLSGLDRDILSGWGALIYTM